MRIECSKLFHHAVKKIDSFKRLPSQEVRKQKQIGHNVLLKDELQRGITNFSSFFYNYSRAVFKDIFSYYILTVLHVIRQSQTNEKIIAKLIISFIIKIPFIFISYCDWFVVKSKK